MERRESDSHGLFSSGDTSDNDYEMGAGFGGAEGPGCECDVAPCSLHSETHSPHSGNSTQEMLLCEHCGKNRKMVTRFSEGYGTEEECGLSDPQGDSDADADIEDTDSRLQEAGSLHRISSRRRKRPRISRQDTTESEDDGGHSHRTHRWNLRLSPSHSHSRPIMEESISQAARSYSSAFTLPGQRRIYPEEVVRQVAKEYYWGQHRRDVEDFCRRCDECAAYKGPQDQSHAPLQQQAVGAPMERVAVDIMGPFPVSDQGNKYVMCAMDYFTKWPEAYALPDQEAETVADTLLEGMFSRFGTPDIIHSDQGRNFESRVFAALCDRLNLQKTRTTPLHPQSDGLVERFNRTMQQQLAILTAAHQRDWDKHIPLVLMAYRSAVQNSTNCTPALLMLGREIRTPAALAYGRPPGDLEDVPGPEYARKLQDRMESAHAFARDQLEKAGMRQKRNYDVRSKEQVGEVVYRVQVPPRGRKVVLHRDRLAPYRGCAPGPHAFVLVLRVDRFTKQEKDVVSKIQHYFSEEALKYTTVVFTHGDQLDDGQKIEDWYQENKDLRSLVQKCGGRCHVFDNKYWNNSKDPYRNNTYQIKQLLQTIEHTWMEELLLLLLELLVLLVLVLLVLLLELLVLLLLVLLELLVLLLLVLLLMLLLLVLLLLVLLLVLLVLLVLA
uniref:Gypsy retrotransposon integrase-like protein 1 n=1 Tax=Knipowitschia caucasica TaxID=637954 RepID=A0AAV2KUW7_KNICA